MILNQLTYSVAESPVRQVRISVRRLWLCMPEQLSDYVQRLSLAHEMARKAMPKVVNAKYWPVSNYLASLALEFMFRNQSSSFAHLHPGRRSVTRA